MNLNDMKLLVIITESALETILTKEIDSLGAHGYTIFDVRGKGSQGMRGASWEASSNIRIEIVCTEKVCDNIMGHFKELYFKNYAMIVYTMDVSVIRPEKF